MKTDNAMPRWAQWAGGIALISLALGAGATGFTLNVTHGLQSGWAPAITYGLADLGKIIIPMVAVYIGWNWHIRLIAAVCVVTSLWCAYQSWDAANAHKATAAEAQSTNWHGAKADADRIRAELASIAETGTSTALLAAAAQSNARADDEKKNGGCLKRCLDARNEAGKLTERAGIAERRERLDAQLAALKVEATASGGPAAAQGGSGLIDTLLFLSLVEGLVWLNMPGAKLIRLAVAARPKPKARRQAKAKMEATAEAKPKKPRKSRAKPKVQPIAEPIAIDRTASLDRIMRQVSSRRAISPVAVN
jgi:hypothetical protein